jgi:uncharacterized YigZ family protein
MNGKFSSNICIFILMLLCLHPGWSFSSRKLLLRSSIVNTASHHFATSEKRNQEVQQTLTTDGRRYESELIIKKSRFIGLSKHCTSWDAAQAFVNDIRNEHPKARHVCFAFVAGYNPKTERCSDDGEPTGTAGVPILGAINGEALSDTVCVVVRYFGGIKLGAGGLIRAYGSSARQVLREAEKMVLVPKSTVNLTTSSSNAGQIYGAANKVGGVVETETYDAKGNLNVTIVCDSEKLDDLMVDITDSTRGDVTFSP